MIGTKLAHYEITSHLGSGGMGDVYQATDSKLGRSVAIKFLPEAFSHDTERVARFQREARVLASLNHPNIAAIYGVEEIDRRHFLVMELISGETLADRINRGAIPFEEALPIAKQIAEALEEAHEKGIIHRDLKPANIKLTLDGEVKVLDFGLAKAYESEQASAALSNSPTISIAATNAGLILGTAGYMSPEQARGRKVDRRADVWAFGCVLYELLTGKRAFAGEDVSETLAFVMTRDVALDALPPATPPAIRSLLRRCLERNLKRRLQHIAEARIVIEDVVSGPVSAPAESAGPASPRMFGPLAYALVVGGVLLGAGIASVVAWTLKPEPLPGPISRFDYQLPQNHQFRNTGRAVMALFPDGSRFVYNTGQGLYLRSMDQLEARLIPGTEEVLTNPFVSPDGQWVGYYQQNQLKKIAISGGAPVNLCPAANPYGASWAPDNTILFGQLEGIRRVSASGGTPELIIKSETNERFDGPQLLPGGEWVLFSVSTGGNWDEARIVVQSLRTQERREVWRGGSDARYVPTGHIVYAFEDDLFAIPFDRDTLKVEGGPVPLVEGVSRADIPATATANYGISDGGALVYVTASAPSGPGLLVWVDRQGKEEAIAAPPRSYVNPRISPDGTRVALEVRDQDNDIVIWNFRQQTLTRFTPTPETESYPVWTPDGARVAYALTSGIAWKAADGSGVAERITEKVTAPEPYFFSPTGGEIIFRGIGPSGGPDLGMVTVGKESDPVWLLKSRFIEGNAEISPDGRWIAYQSDESGRGEVYVRPFPNVDQGQYQISSDGGSAPLWSRNGRELFYLQRRATGATFRLMAVPVQTGAAFDRGNPQVLFDWSYPPALGFRARTYDVSPDGRRFLALKFTATAGEAQPARIIVVQNWLEELKRRVPTGK